MIKAIHKQNRTSNPVAATQNQQFALWLRELGASFNSFWPQSAFAYLRRVEEGDQVCITDHGRPVADILPHRAADDQELGELRGMLLKYDHPMDPVGVDWEANA